MRFGCFGAMENLPIIQEVGFDYVELPVRLVKPELPEEEFEPFFEFLKSFEIVPEVWHGLLEEDIDVYGPEVDQHRLEKYLRFSFMRLEEFGGEVVVFQERGGQLPPDFPRDEAMRQLVEFASTAGTIAGQHGVTLAVAASSDPSNLLVNAAQVESLVKVTAHPFVQALARDGESSTEVPIAHAWASYDSEDPDSDTRITDFLSALSSRGYDERVSVRCPEEAFGDQCRDAFSALRSAARKLKV